MYFPIGLFITYNGNQTLSDQWHRIALELNGLNGPKKDAGWREKSAGTTLSE